MHQSKVSSSSMVICLDEAKTAPSHNSKYSLRSNKQYSYLQPVFEFNKEKNNLTISLVLKGNTSLVTSCVKSHPLEMKASKNAPEFTVEWNEFSPGVMFLFRIRLPDRSKRSSRQNPHLFFFESFFSRYARRNT